jgi:small nuclear ribonucleoprotein (snRNP)-like protein
MTATTTETSRDWSQCLASLYEANAIRNTYKKNTQYISSRSSQACPKNSYIYYSTILLSMAAVVTRKFGEEALQFLGKKVSVETSDQKIYSGTLTGIDERLDVVLDNVEGHGILKVIVNGSFVKEVRLMEKPFDFKALAERLSRVFPGLVKIREDVGAIIVMDKIKVTQAGIEEGSGLAADRVKAIYDEFTRETRK